MIIFIVRHWFCHQEPNWLRITDHGSVPEMRIWSILLIKSDLRSMRKHGIFSLNFSRKLYMVALRYVLLIWDKTFNLFDVPFYLYTASKLACCLFICYFPATVIRYWTSIYSTNISIFWYLYNCCLLCVLVNKFITNVYCWPLLLG